MLIIKALQCMYIWQHSWKLYKFNVTATPPLERWFFLAENKTNKLRRSMCILRINYRMKKTISVKMFIEELGEEFSQHVKDRLMELDLRCILSRKEQQNVVDLKHVEHVKYDCKNEESNSEKTCEKEYVYAQFVVVDNLLYLSKNCIENDDIQKSPIVNDIYDSLNSEVANTEEGTAIKKIDDTNIDYVVDTILSVCPNVSDRYISIVKGMTWRSENK